MGGMCRFESVLGGTLAALALPSDVLSLLAPQML